MKKYYSIAIVILCLFGALASPAIVLANELEVERDDSSTTKTEANEDSIRDRIRDQNEKRQEITKDLRRIASSTKAEIKDIRTDGRIEVKGIRADGKMLLKNASSSMERKEIRNRIRADIFKAQRARLVAQLTLALNNLKQIRARLVSRIEKAESSGRTMTDARALLVTADAKITLAASEIAKLSTFVPIIATTTPITASTTASTTVSASTTPTTEVDLTKPRQMGEVAIKAVKTAHKALVDVVVAIAHNMGVRCNKDGENLRCTATSTPGTGATTTPTDTATTTATTTP